jgi:hypothetical protein
MILEKAQAMGKGSAPPNSLLDFIFLGPVPLDGT